MMDEEENEEDIEARRELRRNQREIGNKILDDLELLCQPGSTLYDEYRQTVNMQFEGAKHSREQLLDAENLKHISFAAKTQASKINNSASVYNFNSFADSIQHQLLDQETKEISWETLGRNVAHLFRTVPTLTFLHGAISKDYVAKERKNAERVRDTDVLLTKAENVIQEQAPQEDASKKEESTNERIKKLRNFLIEKTMDKLDPSKKHVAYVDVLELLVDTKDKVQTIENFFDFAFLIQNKKAAQDIFNDDALYHLPQAIACEEIATDKQQLVISLGMKDLDQVNALLDEIQALELKLNRKKSDVFGYLHREDELYSVQTAQEQAEILQRRQDDAMLRQHEKTAASLHSQQSSSPKAKVPKLGRSSGEKRQADPEFTQSQQSLTIPKAKVPKLSRNNAALSN